MDELHVLRDFTLQQTADEWRRSWITRVVHYIKYTTQNRLYWQGCGDINTQRPTVGPLQCCACSSCRWPAEGNAYTVMRGRGAGRSSPNLCKTLQRLKLCPCVHVSACVYLSSYSASSLCTQSAGSGCVTFSNNVRGRQCKQDAWDHFLVPVRNSLTSFCFLHPPFFAPT